MAYTAHPIWPFPHNWSSEMVETLEWNTDVLAGQTGKEQRLSRRVTPRRTLEATFLMDDAQLQYFEHWMAAHGGSVFVVPLWQEVSRTAFDMLAGATAAIPMDTTDFGYFPGDFVVLRGATTQQWEAHKITNVLPTLVDTATTSAESPILWPSGTVVYPGVLARIASTSSNKKTDRALEVTVQFTVEQENQHPSDWSPNLFELSPVMDTAPDDSEELEFTYERMLSTQDNGMGRPDVLDVAARQFKTYGYRWSVIGRDKLKALVRNLYWLRGRARSIWLPTFMDDLTLISNSTVGAFSLTVKNVGYSVFAMHTRKRDVLRIQLNSGVVLYRRVVDAAVIDADSEVLAVSEAWPSDFTPAEVARISYLIHVRLDQDTVSISHPTDSAGVSHCSVTWKELGEAAQPITVYPAAAVAGDVWKSTTIDWVVPQVDPDSGGEPIAVPGAGTYLLLGYAGSEAEYYRMSAVDGSYLGNASYPADPLKWIEYNYYGAVDDGFGGVWMSAYRYNRADFSAYEEGVARLDTTTWEFDFRPNTPQTPPYTYMYYQANPYNGDVWTNNYYEAWCLLRIDKTDPNFAPAQYLALEGANVHLASPFAGIPDDPMSVAAPNIGIYAGPMVFVSATEAYMIDSHSNFSGSTSNNRLYRIDLTTGQCYYQFQIFLPGFSDSINKEVRPKFYDEATNTLWMMGVYGVWAWVIGSHPSTIKSYPRLPELEVMEWGCVDNQFLPGGQFGEYYNKFDKRLWSGRAYTVMWPGPNSIAGEDEQPVCLYAWNKDARVFTDICITERRPDGYLDYTYTNAYKLQFTSATQAWSQDWGPDYVDRLIKMTKVGPRGAPPLARYVRLAIHKTVDATRAVYAQRSYPLAIQQVEIRSSNRGNVLPVVAVSATTSDPAFPIANILNGDILDPAQCWKAAANTYPIHIDFDLGQAQTVYEVAIWPMNDHGTPSTDPGTGLATYPVQTGAWSAPFDFSVQVSADGVTWVNQRDYTHVGAWFVGVVAGTDRAGSRVFDAF